MDGVGTSNAVIRVGIGATVIALIANLALYLITRLVGVDLVQNGPSGGEALVPISWTDVIIATLVGGILGTAIALLLNRFVARARTVFIVIGALGFLVSMVGPVMIVDSPPSNIIFLTFMHIITAGAVVGLISRVLSSGATSED